MQSLTRRPIILVTGATGAQGGSVARHLLADGRWTVRAFTRTSTSSAARTLRDAGVEIAIGDLDDPKYVRDAMDGCHGVFGVTSIAAHWGRQLRHARAIVDAAFSARVPHVVLRTRADHHHGQGNAHADLAASPHELEAAVVHYARARGIPATFVRVAFHYENLLGRFRPQANAEGEWTIRLPHAEPRLAAVSAEDAGGVVAALFARRDEYLGRLVGVVGDDQPSREYAQALGRALGRRVTQAPEGRTSGAVLDRESDLTESRRLFPRLRTLEEWARENAREFAGVVVREMTPDVVSPATGAAA